MRRVATPVADKRLNPSNFQHGWQDNKAPIPAGYWHNGGTYGYSTMLIIDPQSSKVAFVSNDTEKGTEELARTIFGELD